MRSYRIGEYAGYLGVTPDLLKHYEEMGILQPERSESGYRYYPFHTTTVIIEAVRLRNYGFTLREIEQILTTGETGSAVMEELISSNMQRLEQEIELDRALLEDYEAFQRWRQPLEMADSDWEIRRSEPMCFLPHTEKDEFLQDPRIYEVLNPWMSFIPVVKSSMRVAADGRIFWGFIARERDVEKLRLPVNDVVIRIPSQKIFYYKFRGKIITMNQERESQKEKHPAFRVLCSLGLSCSGDYYRTILRSADWKPSSGEQYGYYALPIDERD